METTYTKKDVTEFLWMTQLNLFRNMLNSFIWPVVQCYAVFFVNIWKLIIVVNMESNSAIE